MDRSQLAGLVVMLLIIILFFSMLGSRTIRPSKHHKGRHHRKKIGGCRGTRHGCCPDGRTACNRNCSNCFKY